MGGKHVGAIDGNDVVIDPEWMWSCDEKSFDCRKNTGFTGIAVSTKPVLQCGRLKVGHLSALGFGNAAGDFLPPGAVANGPKWHPDFQTIFPETTVCVADNGSVTKHSFVQLCEEVLWRHCSPRTKPMWKALQLDSGGGSWLHLSHEFVLWCCRRLFRPKYVKKYCTKATSVLDMEVHRKVRMLWAEWRQDNAAEGDVTPFQGLRAIRSIYFQITQKDLLDSWKEIGCEPNKPWNFSTVLVDRAGELFHSAKLLPDQHQYMET